MTWPIWLAAVSVLLIISAILWMKRGSATKPHRCPHCGSILQSALTVRCSACGENV